MNRKVHRPGLAPSGTPSPTDPLAGVERVFIDGSNLLFALGRGPIAEHRAAARGGESGGAPPVPAGAIIGRLRAAFPPTVSVELVFDGRATGGIAGRLATGLRVSYSGRETADRLIDEGVSAQLDADGPAGTWGILVVTDDRGLRRLVQAKGARVAGTAWLAGRIGRGAEDRPPGTVGVGRGAAAIDRRRRTRTGGGGPAGGGGSGLSDGSRQRGSAGGDGQRGGSAAPRPKAGTTIGHRRPLLSWDDPDPDRR